MSNSKLSDYSEALKKISESPKDRVGILGEVGIVGLGVATGIGGAGTVAAAAGATTILGSSTLGGLLGGVFIATTPVGWVVGTAVAGGAVAYGLSKLFKSGNVSDERKAQNIKNIKNKIEELEKEKNKAKDIDEKHAKVASMYLELIDANLVSEDTVKEILEGIQSGSINIDMAFKNAIDMLSIIK
ncbi:hypothetical protein [Aliarcobacter cryaerophilus]|uniref:hypothetical protein n=1 Tax=Aliarcobacter cryaerophilus TaxID=28198 RepID=UPI003DA4EAB9